MNLLSIKGRRFQINGRDLQIRAGAMHYFRIHPEYWKEQLLKLKQCGLNTLETYIAWNFHEANEGQWDFSGWKDFSHFISLAQQLDLMVIVRPGPYICSEWEFGGFPAWLAGKTGIRLRCMNEVYLKYVDLYFDRILPMLKPLLSTNGGPIIALQVENEYGCAGNDRNYMDYLYRCYMKHGMDVPLFCCDWSSEVVFCCGSHPALLQSVNCGKEPERYLDIAAKAHPESPDMIMEFWSGNVHQWGVDYKIHACDEVEKSLISIMERKASFCLYMFQGGTNFGFMNGANIQKKRYLPFVTSYDADAPLTEAGNPTEKYRMIQSLIHRYDPDAFGGDAASRDAVAYGNIELTEVVGLFESLDMLSERQFSVNPESMEFYGQNYGFILYRTHMDIPCGNYSFELENYGDRAQVFCNGKAYYTLFRNDPAPAMTISEGRLDILVENMGRTNANISEMQNDMCKGLGDVQFERRRIFNWEVYPLPLNDLSQLKFEQIDTLPDGPTFYRGYFELENKADTYLRIPCGKKGVIWINGFNLGRYWDRGPQHSLFVPAPFLSIGRNEIIVFDLHGLRECRVEFIDHMDRALPEGQL